MLRPFQRPPLPVRAVYEPRLREVGPSFGLELPAQCRSSMKLVTDSIIAGGAKLVPLAQRSSGSIRTVIGFLILGMRQGAS